jgi:hypothetical protein
MHIMKKPTTFRTLVTTTLMAALALVPWHVDGQQAPGATATEGAQATAPLVEHLKVEDDTVFVKLPGRDWADGLKPAIVGNAVKQLRRIYPEATFAVDPRVLDVPVSDLIVRANNPMTDLAALRASSGGRFDLHAEPNGLYTLAYNNATEFNTRPSADRQIECFNLTGYLRSEMVIDKAGAKKSGGQAGTSEADALARIRDSAIVQLREMIEESIHDFDPLITMPQVRFYPDAEMLIVIGPERAIDIAAKVIHALPGQQNYTSDGRSGGNYFGPQTTAEQIQAENAVLRNQLLQGAAADKSNSANRP